MYAAVTGLQALGTGMQTISNNIANVNTVGFKAMRTNYEDLISQNYYSGGRPNQKGTGVRVSSIQSMFTQGAFMSSAQDTDMAIAGEGFFAVRNAVTGGINYTRAGVFTLTKDGYMEDPSGNILQGWKLSLPKPGQPAVKIGAPTDVKLTVLNAPPASTTEIKICTNLDADATDAFKYKEKQLAFDYADPIAQAYAEEARAAAVFQIWNEFSEPIFVVPSSATGIYPSPPPDARDVYVRLGDFSHAEPSAITWGAPGTTQTAKVWFTTIVHFTDPNGQKQSAPLEYLTSAEITFDKLAYDYPITSAIIKNTPSVVAQLQGNLTISVSGLPYVYSTLHKAVLPGTDTYTGTAFFNPDPEDFVVPGAIPSPFTTKSVMFEASAVINTPGDIYPPGKTLPSPQFFRIQENRDFPVSESSYTSSNIFAPPAAPSFTYTYSALAASAINISWTTNFNLSDIDMAKTGPISIPDNAVSAGPVMRVIYFTKGDTVIDTNGNSQTSSVTVSAQVWFNTLPGLPYSASDTIVLQGILFSPGYVAYYDDPVGAVLGSTGNLGPLPTTGLFTDTRTLGFPNVVVNSAFTVTGPFPYTARPVDIPAAVSPYKSGDIYMREIPYTSSVTFTVYDTDLEGNRVPRDITSSVTIMVPVAYVVKNLAYSASTTYPVLNPMELTYTVEYEAFSPKEVGQRLYTALYNSAAVDFSPTPSGIFDKNFIETYMSYGLAGVDHPAVDWLVTKLSGTVDDVLEALSCLVVVDDTGLDWPPLPINRIVPKEPGSEGWLFKIGHNEVKQFNLVATELTKLDAFKRGATVYSTTYAEIFKANAGIIEAFLPQWKLEGLGFAAAWDARDLKNTGEYIDSTGLHVEPITIYDSLGSQHNLMIYYQPNPYMENVWDYIITCDPLEDARKDSNNKELLSDTARFSGLIQKGKITFTGDGTDRHGGVIKDIEAQNLDLSLCKMSTFDVPEWLGYNTTYTMKNATIGGYYTGASSIDHLTGNMMSAPREYEIRWGGLDEKKLEAADQAWQGAFIKAMNYLHDTSATSLVAKAGPIKISPDDPLDIDFPSGATWGDYFTSAWNNASAAIFASASVRETIRGFLPYSEYAKSLLDDTPYGANRPDYKDLNPANKGSTSLYWTGNVWGDPPTSGFTVTDDQGNRHFVPVTDKQFAGPYNFGSGLTITFDKKDLPLKFGVPGLDGLKITAHSEQMAWTNLTPNAQGLFDFDVAFVASASMALHPPYPQGLPAVTQHISFDMGARNPLGLNPTWRSDKDMSTTQYAALSTTLFKGQDGHAAGSLQRVSIGEDGIVTGIYSNGSQLELYQIGLTRFINPWGLTKLGDNLFAETRYSGSGAMNSPGSAGTGTILGNFLEQSNVDVAEEIVSMILTQRGFQANTKTVTTVDSMMEEVIHMKR